MSRLKDFYEAQIVPEMTHEPDYLAALNVVEKLGTAAE